MGGVVTTKESKEAKTDIRVLQSQLKIGDKNKISEETLAEIKKLSEDPEYGEEFLDLYRDNLNILKINNKYTSNGYLAAIKFFCLIEANNNITEAYIKVFPERLKRRLDRGQDKESIRGEASRFNKSQIVNEIRKVAGIPVNLIFRHILFEAIENQAKLMRTAKSELVRQKAGATLIAELKPQEDHVLSVKVEDGTKSAIEQLREATEKLAIAEQQSINAGIPIKSIIEGKIVTNDVEDITDE